MLINRLVRPQGYVYARALRLVFWRRFCNARTGEIVVVFLAQALDFVRRRGLGGEAT